MKPYVDTNILVRLYLTLPDTPAATALVQTAAQPPGDRLPVTWLHRAEFSNAIELHVFLGQQGGHKRVTPEQAALAHALFFDDVQRGDLFAATAFESDDLIKEVETLSQRHTAKHGFRTYDLIHVASAIVLGCDTFWSFDVKASRLALLEGLQVR